MRSFQKRESSVLNPYATGMSQLAFPIKEGLILVYARQSLEEYYGNISTDIQTIRMVEHARELCVDPDSQVILINENLQEDGTIRSVSGTWGAEKRSGLSALYERVASGTVKLVLCFQEDRLFRDDTAIEYNNYIKIMKKYGVYTKVFMTGQIYNFSIPWDIKGFRNSCERASDELELKIKGRMQGAREHMVSKGEYSALGSLAIGYVRCEDKNSSYFRKPTEYKLHADVIRQLFQRYYEVGDIYAVHEELVKDRYIFAPLPEVYPRYYSIPGIRRGDPRGATLTRKGLWSILTNPTYAGMWFDRINGKWLHNNHVALVPEEQFFFAFNRLSYYKLDGTPNPDRVKKRSTYANRKEDAEALLEGFIRGEGERKVYHHGGKGYRPSFYGLFEGKGERKNAPFTIKCSEIDDFVMQLIIERLQRTKELERFRDFQQKKDEAVNKLLQSRKVQLDALAEQMAELERKLDIITSDDLLLKLDKDYKVLKARKKAIEDTPIPTLSARDNQRRKKRLSYYELLLKLKDNAGVAPMAHKKIIAEALIDEVIINPVEARFYTLTIVWYASTETYIMQRDTPTNICWKDEDKERLRVMYAEASIPDLLKAFPNRNWQALKGKAYDLGLKRAAHHGVPEKYKKNPALMEYSLDDWALMRAYGMRHTDKAKKIENTPNAARL